MCNESRFAPASIPSQSIMTSTNKKKLFSLNLLVLVFLAAVLSACGGGGGGGTGATITSPQSAAFPVDAAFRRIVTNGFSATLTVGGTIGGLPMSGDATTDWYVPASSSFEGKPALDMTTVSALTLKAGGATQSQSTTTHQFYNANYEPVGQIDADTGRYYVVNSFAGWPKAAKVGDSGSVANVTIYANSTKSTVTGKQAVSYAIEADGASSGTAILVLTTQETDAAGALVLKQDDRFRIGTDGSATFVSSHGFIPLDGANADLTLTATAVAAAKTPPSASGPAVQAPVATWQPNSVMPATGSYVYLESDSGDYIGGGKTYTYTQANAKLSVTANGGLLSVGVAGDQNWSGNFAAMSGVSQLKPGYYGNLQRYPFNSASSGGIDWTGNGRGCNTQSGWFIVDNVTYTNGTLAAVDLRFEQHCEGAAPALHGKIHWAANDTTQVAGPVLPIPASLWSPSAGSVPASGNYVYLQSDSGDYIGAGQTYTYTPSNATVNLNTSGALLTVGIGGAQSWSADFQGMNTLTQLQPGYYGSLQRYPFNNPVLGGLDWDGEGRGCNTLTGWFAVDSISFANGALASIDLRFEQHCEGMAPALRGKIHWVK